jgi:hypothetical protein
MKHYSPTGRRNHGRPLKRLRKRETGTGQQVAQLHDRYMMMMMRMMMIKAIMGVEAYIHALYNLAQDGGHIKSIPTNELISLLLPNNATFSSSS